MRVWEAHAMPMGLSLLLSAVYLAAWKEIRSGGRLEGEQLLPEPVFQKKYLSNKCSCSSGMATTMLTLLT